jgi:hypothetical protein
MKNMDYFSAKRHFDKYGFTTDFSSLAPDSIRYPPGVNIPKGLVNTPRLKERLSVDNASLNPKLENFAEMYQQMASNLLNMSVDKLIPPGHPMYSKENSITLLKEENQKILKENLELKKKLEDKKYSKNI